MTFYLSGVGTYCAFLLFNKFKDQECSKTDPISWLVIAIASMLWIVVIPISLLEIKTKAKAQAKRQKMHQYGTKEEAPQYMKTTIPIQ